VEPEPKQTIRVTANIIDQALRLLVAEHAATGAWPARSRARDASAILGAALRARTVMIFPTEDNASDHGGDGSAWRTAARHQDDPAVRLLTY
jgi:hypothetical protein